MIEFWNVIAALIAGFIAGLVAHSAYLHSKKRDSLRPTPWDHDEDEKEEDEK